MTRAGARTFEWLRHRLIRAGRLYRSPAHPRRRQPGGTVVTAACQGLSGPASSTPLCQGPWSAASSCLQRCGVGWRPTRSVLREPKPCPSLHVTVGACTCSRGGGEGGWRECPGVLGPSWTAVQHAARCRRPFEALSRHVAVADTSSGGAASHARCEPRPAPETALAGSARTAWRARLRRRACVHTEERWK
jgi:hypothetical protein